MQTQQPASHLGSSVILCIERAQLVSCVIHEVYSNFLGLSFPFL